MKVGGSVDCKILREFACLTHASLCFLHLLGAYYNLRKKNYKNATLHGLVFIYDLESFRKHYKEK